MTLAEQFKTETGFDTTTHYTDGVHPTSILAPSTHYVAWLENLLEKERSDTASARKIIAAASSYAGYSQSSMDTMKQRLDALQGELNTLKVALQIKE